MTRRLSLLLVLLAVALVGGCSTTDSRSDAERIVGTREAVVLNARVTNLSVPVRDLPPTTPPSQVTFTTTGGFTLRLALPDAITVTAGGQSVTIPLPDQVAFSGSYTLDEEARRVLLTRAEVGGVVSLRYAFRGRDDLELIAEDAAAIEALLGVAGSDAQQLAGLVQGMSIRFNLSR